MKETVLITGHESEFEQKLAEIFTREGYTVFCTGQQPEPFHEKIDYWVDTTDARDAADTFSLSDGINTTVIESTFRANVLQPMALLEKYLHLLDAGERKRLVFLTAAGASLNETKNTRHFGYTMSKAALHQFIQLTRNKLAGKGYTFRVFDPMTGIIPPDKAAKAAFHYITRRRGTENHDPNRNDEENLVMRDALGRMHGW